jgi:LPXTG-motif cell wall-anchored protein
VRALEPVAGEPSGASSDDDGAVLPWLAAGALLALGAGAVVLGRRRRSGG